MNLSEKEYIFDISSFPFIELTIPPFLYILSSDSFNLIELNWGKALSIEIMWSTDKSFIKLEFLILKHPCWVLLSLESQRNFYPELLIQVLYFGYLENYQLLIYASFLHLYIL